MAFIAYCHTAFSVKVETSLCPALFLFPFLPLLSPPSPCLYLSVLLPTPFPPWLPPPRVPSSSSWLLTHPAASPSSYPSFSPSPSFPPLPLPLSFLPVFSCLSLPLSFCPSQESLSWHRGPNFHTNFCSFPISTSSTFREYCRLCASLSNSIQQKYFSTSPPLVSHAFLGLAEG